MTVAEVLLWGRTIGAVSMESDQRAAVFEYTPAFTQSGIEVSPIVMPLGRRKFTFPNLPAGTFHGLPGLLADSLPDKFGNALIDAWLASQGRTPDSFNAVERLCYTGARGMGALEFKPTTGPQTSSSRTLDVAALVELAGEVLRHREDLNATFATTEKSETMNDILRVGTSAGGARAKAIIAWNPDTNEVRSGQIDPGDGFQHWLLKFDGVSGNRDKELSDPMGFGTIEFAYYNMARAAGITISECRLLEEGNRRHFMTRRFDRTEQGKKLHMQSLCALAHLDFNAAGAHSYEQAILVMRQLKLPMADIEEQFRRMVFNIAARNQDDHVKNIAFLMNKSGHWTLSPAFDLTFSYNPEGAWTNQHQMSMNGKRDNFDIDDFKSCAKTISMKRGRAEAIVDEVQQAVSRWQEFAGDAQVGGDWQSQIAKTHRILRP